eukprot:TRINITY_DN18274_c0_g1_i1.p1 TRINITY_DN18274_c0_g1~~TRINITY_DN18274_c0_g1_i1.p1  ORF type:complete len:289 (-),score=44.87 TRINITY_DN18274_c0_g1_i1:45-911(-)
MSQKQQEWVVALPMYDSSARLQQANDIFYSHLKKVLQNNPFFSNNDNAPQLPPVLTRPTDYIGHWKSGNVLFSQTCGYPYIKSLESDVDLIATPVYNVKGCTAKGTYSSVLIVRQDSNYHQLSDLEGKGCAINAYDSNSGFLMFRAALSEVVHERSTPFFSQIAITGSHLASVKSVASGESDVACIDCVSYEHARQDFPELASRVRVIGFSPSSPALPFVCSKQCGEALGAALREALREVVDSEEPEIVAARKTLFLDGLVFLTNSDYREIGHLEESVNQKLVFPFGG